MKIIKGLFVFFVMLLLVSCNAPTYRESNRAIQNTQKDIHKIEAHNSQTAPPVVVRHDFYVDAEPIQVSSTPRWMLQTVSLQADQVPFYILVNRLLRNTNINASFDNTIGDSQLISMHYTGTLQGALNVLADKTNYYYSVNGQTLNWSAFETHTFDISFMPGSSNYLVGQTENSYQGNTGGSNGFGTSDETNILNDDQYSNLEGELSVWNDLRDTLNRLKSPQGEVVVSESTSSVTVDDHPSNVRAMTHYIDELNHMLSEEVVIKVEVLDIELNKDFNFGIDWDAVINALDTRFNFVSNWAGATNLAANDIVANSQNSATSSLIIGKGEHQTLIEALSKQGRLRVVTKPEVMTMNDQIAAIRITRDTSFIQSVTSTTSGFGDLQSTSITPGTITDGFTLYVLPKVVGNKVYMQISSTLSNLQQLVKESASSGGGGIIGRKQVDAIELPTITEKSFNQRSVVETGSTLVIAGYKNLNSQIANAGLPIFDKLGLGARQNNVETLVLITPIILKTHNGN